MLRVNRKIHINKPIADNPLIGIRTRGNATKNGKSCIVNINSAEKGKSGVFVPSVRLNSAVPKIVINILNCTVILTL